MRAYLDSLRAAGDLHVVQREIDPKHELAAVTAAFQKRHDGAILFENVRGAPMPAVSNVYGSRRRLCALIEAPDLAFCPAWNRLTARAPERAELREAPADRRRIALSDLPQPVYFEKDAGPYITAGILLAHHPETGVPNLSFHRAMHVSDSELRIRIGASHDLTRYQRAAEAKGEALEAAMLIGAAPEIFLAACASIPPDADELAVANAVAGKALAVTACETIGLSVPADTQIVIEGRILPHERRPEGPFGEFMGYYVPEEDNHVFEVTAVTACADPVYHALVCGSPEDLIPLETAIASKIYRHLTALLPGIVDVSCNPQLLNTVVKINKQYEGKHMDYDGPCPACAHGGFRRAYGLQQDLHGDRRGCRHPRPERRLVGLRRSPVRPGRYPQPGGPRCAGLLPRSPQGPLGPPRHRCHQALGPRGRVRAQADSGRRCR